MARLVGDNAPLAGQRDLAIKMDAECRAKAMARG